MTDRPQHLDFLLDDWPYEFGAVSARLVHGADDRELLQLRVEMGVVQMETEGRPDGTRPGDCETYLAYLQSQADLQAEDFELDEDQCLEIDREFVQYFHRRIAWLAVRDFEKAVADADHTLALMDFSAEYSPDDTWIELHEQYRPFVLFHRAQADALATLERADAAAAIIQIDAGIAQIRDLLEVDDEEDDVDLLSSLAEMKVTIKEQYEVQPSLPQQLADAIAAEQYELAAQLRDKLRRARRRRL